MTRLVSMFIHIICILSAIACDGYSVREHAGWEVRVSKENKAQISYANKEVPKKLFGLKAELHIPLGIYMAAPEGYWVLAGTRDTDLDPNLNSAP